MKGKEMKGKKRKIKSNSNKKIQPENPLVKKKISCNKIKGQMRVKKDFAQTSFLLFFSLSP